MDFPIPGNDDALKSVQLIARAVSDAIISEKEKMSPEEILAATEAAQEEGASDKEVELEAEEEEVPPEETKRKHRVVHKKIVRQSEDE